MEPRGRERHRWASREAEWSFRKSDIEGKAAMVAASELGSERVSNERERMSQSFPSRAHRSSVSTLRAGCERLTRRRSTAA